MKKLDVDLVLLALIFMLSLLGQFARVSTSLGMVNLFEIAMAVLTFKWAWQFLGQIATLFKKPIVKSLLILFAWILASTVLSSEVNNNQHIALVGISYLARTVLYAGFAAGIWLFLRKNQDYQKWVLPTVIAWLLTQAFYGIGQFLLYPDSRILFYLGWDDHLSRAFGTLLDPGFFGALMAIGGLSALSINWKPKWQVWQPAILSIFAVALSLSYSRASYLAFVCGCLVLAYTRKKLMPLLGILVLIGAVILLPKDGGGEGQNLLRTRSVAAREEVLEFHSQGLNTEEVIAGRGWYYESSFHLHEHGVEANRTTESNDQNTEVVRQNAGSVDNIFAHVFFSSGLIGLGLFGYFLWQLYREFRSSPVLLSIWGAVLVHSLFSTALLYPWVLLALIFVSLSDCPLYS